MLLPGTSLAFNLVYSWSIGTPREDMLLTVISHRLEERRKAKGAAYYERKKVAARQLADAKKSAKVKADTKKGLTAYGY
jgi:hypothetical protein